MGSTGKVGCGAKPISYNLYWYEPIYCSEFINTQYAGTTPYNSNECYTDNGRKMCCSKYDGGLRSMSSSSFNLNLKDSLSKFNENFCSVGQYVKSVECKKSTTGDYPQSPRDDKSFCANWSYISSVDCKYINVSMGVAPDKNAPVLAKATTNTTRQMIIYALPFLKNKTIADIFASKISRQCMNGIREAGEECEINLTAKSPLDNSTYCPQSTTWNGGINMVRDAYGSCGVDCKCTYDSFKFAQVGITPALAALNSCESSSNCSAHQACISGKCINQTYCGDGIVQTKNDEGEVEECEPLSLRNALRFGVSDIGECKLGASFCTQSCTWSPLKNLVLPAAEKCDGLDNNCNNLTDEGCSCSEGSKQSCGVNLGVCKNGTQTCTPEMTWGLCNGGVSSSNEICDSLDNNCNGEIDEGLSCLSVDDLKLLRESAVYVIYRANAAEGVYSQIGIVPASIKSFTDPSSSSTQNWNYRVVKMEGFGNQRRTTAFSDTIRVGS
jgi:hypothetical protein